MNDVCLDGAEGLVFDDDEDLLLFFQVYEVTEPRFLGKPVYIKDREKTHDYVFFFNRIFSHTEDSAPAAERGDKY